ncbi:Fusaric acid resistance protein-like-domain-containing protein [Aspergillus desertorum]
MASRRLSSLETLPTSTHIHQEQREPFLLSINEESIEEEPFRLRLIRTTLRRWSATRESITPELAVGIFKCSLAYLIASLAVFLPPIGNILGHQNGKHLVATITIYFHPARSQGSMYKALICAFIAFVFAAFLSLSSMWVTIFFHRKHHLIELGHAMVLLVFVMGGFGFIGWIKQRLSDPLVNVACSLASLASIIVITKEGAVQMGELSFTKISQVLRMVILGVGIASAVSLFILPVSARKKFRGGLSTLTDTVTVMLISITESFVRGSDHQLETAEFANLSARHDRVFGLLKQLLVETRLEHYMAGTGREHCLEKRLVYCMRKITHSLGCLRGAVDLQTRLLASAKYTRCADLSIPTTPEDFRPTNQLQTVSRIGWQGYNNEPSGVAPETEPQIFSTQSPAEILERLTIRLEEPTLSFASSLREAFTEVSFGPAPDHNIIVGNRVHTRIGEAVNQYREARNAAFSSLWSEWEMMPISTASKAGLDEVFANCEYFSVFLIELSQQLKELVSALMELQAEAGERPEGRSWDWLRPRWWADQEHARHHSDTTSSTMQNPAGGSVGSSVSRSDALIMDQSEGQLQGRTRMQKATDHVWRPFDFFRRDEIKFALKVGIGAALYALPSFISVTRPIYLFWRGEWGLVSYMLVCSMTIGASNTTGIARFVGTCIGGLCSLVAWYIAGGDAFKLAAVGFIMTIGPFYIIIVKGQGPMGRFILLTYNLSVLYAFSYSQTNIDNPDGEGEHHDITEIVLHRVASVMAGNIWGIIITRGIWPIRARTKLNETLQSLWLRLLLIWESDPLNTITSDGADASTPVAPYMNRRDKTEIDHLLSQLEPMQTAARSEGKFKNPFPAAAYSNVIRRAINIVDNFHSMDFILSNTPTYSQGQISLLRYTATARQQLSECISNMIAAIASSVQHEHTLSDFFSTSAADARFRLLIQISQYRQDKLACHGTNNEDYVLLYSYVLVSHQLSNEIGQIMAELRHIFPAASDRGLAGAVRV